MENKLAIDDLNVNYSSHKKHVLLAFLLGETTPKPLDEAEFFAQNPGIDWRKDDL
jgi:hypothetical protein